MGARKSGADSVASKGFPDGLSFGFISDGLQDVILVPNTIGGDDGPHHLTLSGGGLAVPLLLRTQRFEERNEEHGRVVLEDEPRA